MSDGWLHVGQRSYSLDDIAGANLSPRNSSFRLFSAGIVLLCAISAALAGDWLIALGAGLVLFCLLHSIRTSSSQYVVSWITRGGREGRHRLHSREDADRLMAFLLERRVAGRGIPKAGPVGNRPRDLLGVSD